MKVKLLSHVQPSVTQWTVAYQAALSMGFSRQEYWSRLPFPSPEDLPNPGIEPLSSALAGGFFTTEPPGKPSMIVRDAQKNEGKQSELKYTSNSCGCAG